MILNSLNWNIEVFLLSFSDFFIFICIFLFLREFGKTKQIFFLNLMITIGILFISILFRVLSTLLRSPFLFKMHILTVIPCIFFGILAIDKLNRYSIDPMKTLIFGICSTGIIFSLLNPDSVIEIEVISGDICLYPNNSLKIWVILLISSTFSYLSYYLVLIYMRTPKHLKKKIQLFCVGGIFTGVITMLFFLFGIPSLIPGLEMVPLATGIFLFCISFLKSPEIIQFVLKSGEISRIKYIKKFLPICAKCKKIKDNEGNWHQLEQYLLNNSEIKFSHGYCPECGKKVLSEIDDDQ